MQTNPDGVLGRDHSAGVINGVLKGMKFCVNVFIVISLQVNNLQGCMGLTVAAD